MGKGEVRVRGVGEGEGAKGGVEVLGGVGNVDFQLVLITGNSLLGVSNELMACQNCCTHIYASYGLL